MGPVNSVFDHVTYFTMLHFFHAGKNPALFQTGWFLESLLSQTLIIHIIRTAKVPFFQSHASVALIRTSVAIAAIGVALPHTSLGALLGFVPLPGAYWPALIAILAAYALLAQRVKTRFVRRFGLS